MNALVYNTFHHPFPYTTAQAAPETMKAMQRSDIHIDPLRIYLLAINPVSKTKNAGSSLAH